jgi:aminoglycoside phosphotransferase (APT) family kinase protein
MTPAHTWQGDMQGARIADATQVLRAEWGIDAAPGQPHLGLTRLTWQIGTTGWLAREPASRLTETLSEARLLSSISALADFAVPTPIPTLQGQLVAHVGDFVWTLRRHLAGERLADEPASYQRLVELLPVVHRSLRGLNARDVVLPESLLSLAYGALRDAPGAHAPAAREAAAWLRGRIAVLDALPSQAIHGDFGLPNVLVAADDPARFAVLDWELSSYDSAIFDLAQIAFGMIAFSRLQPPPSLLRSLSRQYAASGGQTFSEAQLAAALVAGRLATIALLQGRLSRGETTLTESVRFLDARLGRTLRWLNE